jgi:hypothetical protein
MINNKKAQMLSFFKRCSSGRQAKEGNFVEAFRKIAAIELENAARGEVIIQLQFQELFFYEK